LGSTQSSIEGNAQEILESWVCTASTCNSWNSVIRRHAQCEHARGLRTVDAYAEVELGSSSVALIRQRPCPLGVCQYWVMLPLDGHLEPLPRNILSTSPYHQTLVVLRVG